MTDQQTLAALRNAAMSGTSLRHAAEILGATTNIEQQLNEAAHAIQQADGTPPPHLDWKHWAKQQRARYKLARKTRKLNSND